MCYIREIINNLDKAIIHLKIHKNIELACIYCKKIYKICDSNMLKFNGYTLYCNTCTNDVIIPIVQTSILNKMNNEERFNKLKQWHKEIFETMVDDNFYYDYGYYKGEDEILK